jgi:hypothetical protein
MKATKTAAKGWKHLKYSIYFCHGEIKKLLLEKKSRKEVLAYFAPVKATKAYFECVRMAELTNMREVRDEFKKMGIQPCGALLPADKGPLCYNNVQQMELLEKRVTDMAELFDEIIVDDWLFTNCTCEKCVAGRGAQTWAEYRPKLLAEQSAKRILAPARRVNPKVKVIVKFPNWYEGHAFNGYSHELQIAQFDEFCTGTETRKLEEGHQHIPVYSAYFFRKWYSNVDKKKAGSVWHDNWDMLGYDKEYLAQIYQGILGGSDEIVIWSGGHHHKSGPWGGIYPALKKELPAFEALAGLLAAARPGAQAKGVDYYMPHESEGPYMLFGYLGMSGIPLNPVTDFPSSDGPCLLPDHAAKDPDLGAKIIKRLKEGKDVVMTYGLVQRLQHTEIRHFLQIVTQGGTISSKDFAFNSGKNNRTLGKSQKEIVFPKLLLSTWPYVRQAVALREDGDYSLVMSFKYLNGKVTVLNLPENLYDLFRLPEGVLNVMRKSLDPNLGVRLNGPGMLALYTYDPALWVVYNVGKKSASASLQLSGKNLAKKYVDALSGKKLAAQKDGDDLQLKFTLKPFEMLAIRPA